MRIHLNAMRSILRLVLVPGVSAIAASSASLLPSMASELPLLRIGADAALAAGRHMTSRLGTAEVLSTKH